MFAFLLGGHLGVESLVTWQLYFKRLEERQTFPQGQHHFISPLEKNKGSHFSTNLPTPVIALHFHRGHPSGVVSLRLELHLPDGF